MRHGHQPLIRTKPPYSGAGDEPALAEVLADPIVHLLMGRDRLDPGCVAADLEGARMALMGRNSGRQS